MRLLVFVSFLFLTSVTHAEITSENEARKVFQKITNIINRSSGGKHCFYQENFKEQKDYSLANYVDNQRDPCFIKYNSVHTHNGVFETKVTWSFSFVDLDINKLKSSPELIQTPCGDYAMTYGTTLYKEKLVEVEVLRARSSSRALPYTYRREDFNIYFSSTRWAKRLRDHMYNLASYCQDFY